MNEHYVSYEQSQALKRLGFDCVCDRFWYKEFVNSDKMTLRQANTSDFNHDDWDVPHYSAPRLDQAHAWLREKYQFFIYVTPCIWHKHNIVFDAQWIWNSDNGIKDGRVNNFKTYELALSVGIDKALKLLEKGE